VLPAPEKWAGPWTGASGQSVQAQEQLGQSELLHAVEHADMPDRAVLGADVRSRSKPGDGSGAGLVASGGHFGAELRHARERQGLSVHDVANKTRISVHWIQALEDARLDCLPAPVFISGYLRSYARSVGLDGAEILRRYHELVEQRSEEAELAERGAHAISSTSRWRKPLIWLGLLLLVALALAVAAWRRGVLPAHPPSLS
jgi:transcriptional regulator with XRE-family HTH domain